MLADALPTPIWIMGPDGRFSYRNRHARDLLSPAAIDRIGHRALRLVPAEHRKRIVREWRTAMAHRGNQAFECPLFLQGRVQWVLLYLSPLQSGSDGASDWIGLAFDIERFKNQHADLQEAAQREEKKRRTSHHQNQNSLQIVSGLLTLQAHRIAEPDARSLLMETRDQIATIAQLQRAARTGESENVEFVGFLREFMKRLAGPHEIQVAIEAPASLALPVDRALPVALMIEALTREVLQGAGDEKPNELRVSVSVRPGEIWIDLAHDGEDASISGGNERPVSLGMDILPSLAEQAGGRLEVGALSTRTHRRLVLRD